MGSPVTSSVWSQNSNTSTALVSVGEAGHSADYATGRVYRARAWTGLTFSGTPVIDFDPSQGTDGASSFTSGGRVWTLGSPATVANVDFTAYHAALAADPGPQVYEDDVRLSTAALKAALIDGSFWYDSGNARLYVRMTADDNPSGHVVEASTRDSCIVATAARNGCRYDSLQLEKGATQNLYYAWRLRWRDAMGGRCLPFRRNRHNVLSRHRVSQ